MEPIIDIMNGTQRDSNMDEMHAKQLRKIMKEGSIKERNKKWDFFKKGCIDRILIHPKNHPSVEKSMNFISIFVSLLSDDEMKIICDHVCSRLQSVNKMVRQRCCQLIGTVLANALAKEIEVCCDILDSITMHLLKRLNDKAPSVRSASITALQLLQNVDDPDDCIIKELCRVMGSDSSASVRVTVVGAVALTEQSLPKLLNRIRDIKSEVRIAAIKRIHFIPISKLACNARAAIVRHGLVDRDLKVRNATQELIQSWFKTVNFNVASLLRAINPMQFEDEALLLGSYFAQESTSEDKTNIVSDDYITEWNLETALTPTFLYSIMWTYIRCAHARGLRNALVVSEICDTYLPDAVTFCRLIDQLVVTNGIAPSEKKNCALKYIIKASALIDPSDVGGINQLLELYTTILARSTLPYDLVTVTLKAHCDLSQHIHSVRDFYDIQADIFTRLADSMRSSEAVNDEANNEIQERSLQILQFMLRHVAGKINTSDKWIATIEGIVPFLIESLQQLDANIRCIAVSCIGLICLTAESLCEKYRPIILQVASGGFEEDIVVCVAVQGLTDICLVHREKLKGNDYEICNVLTRLLRESESELVRIASESTAKLLFSGCIQDPLLLSNLLRFFFVADLNPMEGNLRLSSKSDDEVENVVEVLTTSKMDGSVKLQQLLTLFFKSFMFSGGRCEQLLLDAVPLLVAELTVDIREESMQLSTMNKVVKHLMDLCSGMDSQSAEKSAEPTEMAADEEMASEGDDESGPQVKKKRTSKPKRSSSSMKSASMHTGVDGGLKTVREECEGEEEDDEGDGNKSGAVTERVKERLFAALCRDMLKLGDCKGTDKVLIKEYIKLCSSVCDCGWLAAENGETVRKILQSISAVTALDKASQKLLDRMLVTCDQVGVRPVSQDIRDSTYDKMMSFAPGLADLLALQSQNQDSDDDEDDNNSEKMPSVASSRISKTESKKSVRESIARKAKGKKTPILSSSDEEDEDDDNSEAIDNDGAPMKEEVEEEDDNSSIASSVDLPPPVPSTTSVAKKGKTAATATKGKKTVAGNQLKGKNASIADVENCAPVAVGSYRTRQRGVQYI